MWITLQRLIAWVARTDASGLSMAGADFQAGSWHGDHWQNLLCSPMDARHYVMEDWAVQPEPDFTAERSDSRRR